MRAVIAAAAALLVILLLPLWVAAAAIDPVGRRSDCYGCDFRVRKLFPVELSSQLTVCLYKISVESINFIWPQRFVILKRAGDRSLNGQATFCSIVWDNKYHRTLFRIVFRGAKAGRPASDRSTNNPHLP